MSDEVTLYKIFIASPGNLEDERKEFRKIIQQFNEEEAIRHRVQYFPVYWEKVAGGICDRPQTKINIELDNCDYMLVVLWDRWGTPPDNANASSYKAGVEEEFYRAIECYRDSTSPMKDVVVFFKEINQRQRNDPGAQVSQVLAFREKLDQEQNILYKTFDDVDGFEKLVKMHLRAWLENDQSGSRKIVHNFRLEFSPYQNKHIEHISFPGEAIDEDSALVRRLDEIKRLADNNEITKAKEEYRELVIETQDIAAKNDYAKYLYRLGHLDKAEDLYQEIHIEAIAGNNLGWISRANANLAIIKKSKGLIDDAQRLLDESIVYNRMLEHDAGIADNYRHLANIKRSKGDIDSALSDAKEALRIFKKMKYKPGLADCYSDLGVIYRIVCDLEKAEECYGMSLKLNEELDRQSCQADNRSHYGTIARIRGDLVSAKKYYSESLATNYNLRRKHGVAEEEGHLAMVATEAGDYDVASRHFKTALITAEQINNKEVIAKITCGMAKVHIFTRDINAARRDLDEAEAINTTIKSKEGMATVSLYRGWLLFAEEKTKQSEAEAAVMTALVYFQNMNNIIGVAESYELLAVLRSSNGDYDGAHKYCKKGLSICDKVGAKLTEASIRATLAATYQNAQEKNEKIQKANYQLDMAVNLFRECGATRRADRLIKYQESKMLTSASTRTP